MTTGHDVVAAAREYLGTPFVHQGRLRGVGVDCVGLAICVAHDLGLSTADVTGYARAPDPVMFRRTLAEHLDPVEGPDVQVGDVLTFAFEREQHLGIATRIDTMRVVHAYARARPPSVVEHDLDAGWMQRWVGCYRFRGLA